MKLDENSPEYWERVLRESGLSMNSGRPPQRWIDRGTPEERREDIVIYVGTSNDLVGMEEEENRKVSGKVAPEGHGSE